MRHAVGRTDESVVTMTTDRNDLAVDLSGKEVVVVRDALREYALRLREYALRLRGDVRQLRAAEPHPSARITSLTQAHERAADVADELLERIAPASTIL